MLDILFSNVDGSGETSQQYQGDDTTTYQTPSLQEAEVLYMQTETDVESQQQDARKKQVQRRKTRPTNQSSQELEHIDSLQQDYIPNHLSSDNGSSDEENDEFKGRYKDFVLEKFLKDPMFENGMKFDSRAQFKYAIIEYGIRWVNLFEPTKLNPPG